MGEVVEYTLSAGGPMEIRHSTPSEATPSTGELIELRHPDVSAIISRTRFASTNQREARVVFEDLTTRSLENFLRFRWELTPSEFALAQEAMSFVDRRYSEMGITDLPKAFGPFIYEDVDFFTHDHGNRKNFWEDLAWAGAAGRGSAMYRVLGVREQSGVSVEFPTDFACKIAHEYTHALGAVRVSLRGLRARVPDLSGLQIDSPEGHKLFACLDEYVAELNSHCFLLSKEGISEIRSLSNVDFDLAEMSAKHQEAIIEVVNRLQSPLREEEGQFLPKQLESLYYRVVVGGKPYAYRTGYGVNNASIRALAAEMFEEYPAEEAESLFSRYALLAHVTGEYQDFFKLIKSKLGARGLKVLAFSDPYGDVSLESGLFIVSASTALLSLYAAARKLPLDEREYVRDLISVAIDPRGASKA